MLGSPELFPLVVDRFRIVDEQGGVPDKDGDERVEIKPPLSTMESSKQRHFRADQSRRESVFLLGVEV